MTVADPGLLLGASAACYRCLALFEVTGPLMLCAPCATRDFQRRAGTWFFYVAHPIHLPEGWTMRRLA